MTRLTRVASALVAYVITLVGALVLVAPAMWGNDSIWWPLLVVLGLPLAVVIWLLERGR